MVALEPKLTVTRPDETVELRARSRLKPVWLVALFTHDRFTCVELAAVAAKELGAAGMVTVGVLPVT